MRGMVLLMVAAALVLGVMGCYNSSPPARSSLLVNVQWPARGRMVPLEANSVAVTVSEGSSFTATQTATYPAGGGTSQLAFSGVPVGTLTVTSIAYASTDGTGTALATGTQQVTTVAGTPGQVTVSLDSTITQVAVTGMPASLKVGQTATLTATPKNAAGAAVPVAAGNLTWTSSNSTIASVNKTTGAVMGVKTGSATITAMESESGVKGTAAASVSVVTVSITQRTVTLDEGGTQTFTATVTGAVNAAVTWSAVDASGGSFNGNVYTAPAIHGTYHVKAVSVADTTDSDTVTVTVEAPTVSIDQRSATLSVGKTQTFTATVTNALNPAVSWSVVETSGGSITPDGVYTAPAVHGTYHVMAVSVADGTVSDTVAVTVQSSGLDITIQ